MTSPLDFRRPRTVYVRGNLVYFEGTVKRVLTEAAERRKNVATAEGRGFHCDERMSRSAAKDSFAPTGLNGSESKPRAYARGYILSPLRGSILIIILLLLPAMPTLAADKWLSIHTKNFLLIGNASESEIRKVRKARR